MAQLANVAQSIARSQIEVAHLGIGMGENDLALAGIGATLRVPCIDQLGTGLLARLTRVDHAKRRISVDRLACPACRKRLRRIALQVFALSAYLGDFGRTVALGEGTE